MDAETRAELAALRAEVAQLRARPERLKSGRRWRRAGSFIAAA